MLTSTGTTEPFHLYQAPSAVCLLSAVRLAVELPSVAVYLSVCPKAPSTTGTLAATNSPFPT